MDLDNFNRVQIGEYTIHRVPRGSPPANDEMPDKHHHIDNGPLSAGVAPTWKFIGPVVLPLKFAFQIGKIIRTAADLRVYKSNRRYSCLINIVFSLYGMRFTLVTHVKHKFYFPSINSIN